VTEAAARKLASLLEEKGQPEGALRLKVIGGGCSGLQLRDGFGRWTDGARTSLFRLKAYDSLLIQKARYSLAAPCSITARICKKGGFKVTNPNAVAHCSCGESFAV